MTGLRYIEGVVTLKLDAEKCNGCMLCTAVCLRDELRARRDQSQTGCGMRRRDHQQLDPRR
jgi:ferredoxin